MKVVIDMTENIMGKGENVGIQNFFPLPKMFYKGFSAVQKSRHCAGKA